MRTQYIIRLIPVFTILCACQSEVPQEISAPTNSLMVKASFPGSNDTRTQITYGNPDKTQEIFSWTEGDEIFLYNMSRINEYPDEACFKIQPNFGRSANFVFSPGADGHAKEFKVFDGDILLALYGGDTNRVKYKKNDKDTIAYPDERNIVRIGVGTEANYPQYILTDPDDSSMSYMQDNLKMYDIVTVVKNDEIPDLSFKHLSAILRISLQNKTGHDIYPTKLEFRYPTKSPTALEGDGVNRNPSFFNTSLYCSVETNENCDQYLKVYDTDDFFTSQSKPYTENISTTINGKDVTSDAGDSIKNGESYELYLSTIPRIGNDSYGEKFSIDLIQNHDTNNPYSITIDKFNKVIEAGKRYWFNLTAVEEQDGTRKLMLTSDWLEQQKNQNANEGDQTIP